MALDLSGFNVPEEKFEGLYQAAGSLQRRNIINQRLALAERGRQDATGKFLADYLDPSKKLTGTAYDPMIVSGLQSLLQQGETLTSKGASTSDVLMALGPQVQKLNDYSTKAKLINNNINASVGRLKSYTGYDPDAITQQARKEAFQNTDGSLKDISSVDPTTDYVTEAAKNNPGTVTTGKGLDDFVAKTPMHDFSNSVTTTFAGRGKTTTYDAKAPFYMGLKKNADGTTATDDSGNPAGLSVLGSPMLDDKGKPITNPDNGQPMMAMDKDAFNAVMQHNPDIADNIRGEVIKHFKAAGAQQTPAEGSPQWDMMARNVLYDELQARDKSYFKTRDQQKESAQAIKIDIAQDPNSLDAIARFNAAQKDKGQYAIYDPKAGKAVKTNAVQTVGEIFNNNPAFLQGPSVDRGDGTTAIDVTDAFPGGGLKTGRGDDTVDKTILYDPQKRQLIVRSESKEKGPDKKPLNTTDEVIPESKAGLFMSRIAASNGVDPDKVGDIFNQVGYHGAKFTNPGGLPGVGQRVNEEHAQRLANVDKALDSGNYGSLAGHPTKDGPVAEVVSRNTAQNWVGMDKYAVYTTDANGKKVKSFTTDDKDKLAEYLKGGQSVPTSGGAINADAIKKKLGINY